MQRDDAKNIFNAVDDLYLASSRLIMAIDGIEDANERRALRKKYAEMIANIEHDFVYKICVSYPEYAGERPR